MNIDAVYNANATMMLDARYLKSSTYADDMNVDNSVLTDEYSESGASQRFKNIVKNYDITDISPNETKEMYQKLYDDKFISLKEMSSSLSVNSSNDVVLSASKSNFYEKILNNFSVEENNGNSEDIKTSQCDVDLANKISFYQNQAKIDAEEDTLN